ncbi:MAG: PAS domain S-box protein [Prosthecobacter sp.]|jgi:PAS domain S-box-containing protein|uniref:hybrid sensor histidine kinase/response regulator n=1 Tax=Prosthecobacter sp. TaxID=1965333 RepID=UPI001A0779FC|nr:ATP-binding protein [Prosthecobacter sp.]MBE2285887.1 PAS domain S-box protein [Prosthecobacter sp.]
MSVTNFLQRPSFPLPVREELPSLRQFFTRAKVVCGAAAGLLLLTFVTLKWVDQELEKRSSQGAVAMNMLARQRMESQMLVRLALQAEQGRPGEREFQLQRLKRTWAVMSANQSMLESDALLPEAGERMPAMDARLSEAGRSFAAIEKSMQKIIPHLEKHGAGTLLPDGPGETLPAECDAFASDLERVAELLQATSGDIHDAFTLVGWLRIGAAALIVFTAMFLLTRGQISPLKRLIETTNRFEELTYLQNAILENAACSIISTNPEGVIITFNRGAENLTGYSRDEMVGLQSPELIHDGEEVVRVAAETSTELGTEITPGFEVFVAHARRGIIREREWTYIKKDGSRVPVSLSVTAMRSPDGRITGFLGVARDVTEKKRLEQQFLRAQRIESIGTLAGGIAHDLNNVLTPILVSIELLRATNTNERMTSVLANIESSAKRGADMVRQILSFARGVEGERTIISPGRAIKDIQRLIHDTFPKNIRCIIDAPADLPSLMGDPTQLHQILLNLCVNARDAMPGGGTLTITLQSLTLDESAASMQMDAKPGSYISIRVKDTGLGIPREILDKIFDPFFTTKEIGKGTGLGLSTVLAITRSHGGFLQVSSEPGDGSTFIVCLPALAEAEKASAEAVVEEQLPSGGGKLILVVDDEENVRSVTQHTLEALGYRTLSAADGVEAVAIYSRRNNEIAAVLTDMMMPVMSGPATIQVLKRINPSVKIIAASGITQQGGLATAAEMGVKHLLPKPYSAQTMLATLHTALN